MIVVCIKDYSTNFGIDFKINMKVDVEYCCRFGIDPEDPTNPYDKNLYCYYEGMSRGASAEIHLPKTHFILLEDWRNKKINEIL